MVDHLDLYRVENESDLESTGFWDLFEKEEGLIFVEWAERLGKAGLSRRWSVTSVHLDFHEDEGQRSLQLEEVQ